ncbi:MAG: TfuA-like protein, partial [Mycobacterium sp.]
VPSVQHKEILFALNRGIRVYGCSSMGAIRAAELADCGMVGIGGIFRSYRDGTCTDDDEVAVAHADHEHSYRALSTPMVTIRRILSAAACKKIVTEETAATLVVIAKQLFYADRHWGTLIERGRAAGLENADLSALRTFVRGNSPDPKRDDAIEALRSIDRAGSSAPPRMPSFEATYNWAMLIADEVAQQERSR